MNEATTMRDAPHRPPPPELLTQDELGEMHPDGGVHGFIRSE